LKKIEDGLKESIRRLYRTIALPDKSGLKVEDLGIPTFGEEKAIDHEIYDKLRSGGEILEKIVPLVIKEKYLHRREFISTLQIYQSSMRSPGEARFANRSVLEHGISEGVNKGIFGIGELEGDKPVCRYFKEDALISFSDSEILISDHICHEQKKKEEPSGGKEPEISTASKQESTIREKPPEEVKVSSGEGFRDNLLFRFIIPKGKVSDIMRVINYLQTKFETIEIELIATHGRISNQEVEEKVREAFRQLGIELDLEN